MNLLQNNTKSFISSLFLSLALGLSACDNGGNPNPNEPFCGDGFIDEGEVCDDENAQDGDGCRADCKGEEICGDGLLDAEEECDDGNTANGDECDSDCTISTCGNGASDPGELCYKAPVDLTFIRAKETVTGDIDDDGDLDLIVTHELPPINDGISIVKNFLGSFSVSDVIDLGIAIIPKSPVLADFDGDGDLDLAFLRPIPEQHDVEILRNDGDGNFANPVFIRFGEEFDSENAIKLLAGDVGTPDGDIDLVVVTQGGQTVHLFENLAPGVFAAQDTITLDARPAFATLANISGTGGLDLVVSVNKGEPEFDEVQVFTDLKFTATAGNFFADQVNIPVVDASLRDVLVFKKDNFSTFQDIAVIDASSDDIIVLDVLNSAITSINQINFETELDPFSMVSTDADGDGDQDIITGATFAISILQSSNNGNVMTPKTFEVGVFQGKVSQDDINEDGLPDVVITGDDTVEILLSTN